MMLDADDEFLARPRDQQVSYWVGQVLIAIGKGKFREEISTIIEFYQREAYYRGLNAKAKS
jgi:hypothetical protein